MNPTEQPQDLADGLEYISTLINRYTVNEEVYRRTITDTSQENIRAEFENMVTKLYAKILEYQARVAVQLSRHSLLWIGRDTLKIDCQTATVSMY